LTESCAKHADIPMRSPSDIDPTLEAFRRATEPSGSGIDLAHAHVALGRFEYPALPLEPSLLGLDALSMRVAE